MTVVEPNPQFSMNIGGLTIQEKPAELTSRKPKHQEAEEAEDDEERGDDASDSGKKDEEYYLPKDSPLRSKNGDKKAPLNPTFKDYEAFVNSCSFDFWRDNFESQSADKLLSDTAQTIVANICNTQSRNQLRVNHGHVPLRKKREQITPLALVLHEIKLWATHQLRTASIFEEDTYKEIRYRINYLDALAHKEVWGDTAYIFASGMRAVAFDKLFRLFLSSKEVLERAEEYAYRGYCQRSSREKLQRIENLLKKVVTDEMKMLSAVMTLDKKLEDPKTSRLQPSDLLNTMQNQSFVDYRNFVNVLLYRLCQNPLVRAALTAEYDKPRVMEIIEDLGSWSQNNLFCRPSGDGGFENEPEFLMDSRRDTRILPEVYTPTAVELKRLIREVDPKAPVPVSGKKHVNRMKEAFGSEKAAARVVKLVMKNIAAIQELIPGVFAMHQLWLLAGDGGDFTVYDTLREHVIKVMQDTANRVHSLRTVEETLLKEIGHLCGAKEEAMKKEALRKGKMKYKPAWVMNYKFLKNELLRPNKRTFEAAIKQLFELGSDAWKYDLTTDQLNDKVESAKKIFDALTGGAPETINKEQINKMGPPPINMKPKKQDWLRSDSVRDEEFGTNNEFNDNQSDKRFNPFAEDEDEDSDDY